MSRNQTLTELREWKQLLDDGLITRDQFEEQQRSLFEQLKFHNPQDPKTSSLPRTAPADEFCLHCCLPRSTDPHCSVCGQNGNGLPVYNHPSFLAAGSVLDGKYLVGRVLGHGGFGVTYLASDRNLDLRVAIKEFYPRELVGRDPYTGTVSPYPGEKTDYFQHGLTRFLEEAQVLARFNHRAVVQVLSYFQENGTGYLVMRYLEGRTLEEELAHTNRLPAEKEVIEWTVELLSGLEVVHQQGLLHRDIKPSNVYLTNAGQVVLLDFGNARLSNQATGSLTKQYTPGYSPPEQTGMLEFREGPWTDLYAVGALVFRLLNGHIPPDSFLRLQGASLESRETLSASTTSQGIKSWWTKALAIPREQRFLSVESALNELQKCANTALESSEADNTNLFPKEYQAPIVQQKLEHLPDAVEILCPPGYFSMGSSRDEKNSKPDERPSRVVKLTRGFWALSTPVTQEMYKFVTGTNPSFFRDGTEAMTRPVEMVHWLDAIHFCILLSKLANLEPAYALAEGQVEWKRESCGYRLPTEAEWEYLCRAGTNHALQGPIHEHTWFDENSKHSTQPVRQKQPNAWGFYDTLGNVWEWCQDDWNKMAYTTLSQLNPVCYSSRPSTKVVRGGSWNSYAKSLRPAERHRFQSDYKVFNYGFRIVRNQPGDHIL